MADAGRTAGLVLGAILLTLGWLALAGGGLLALVVGVLEFTGYGDAGPHFAWEDVEIPAGVLALGAALLWSGRALRRAVRPPPSSAPPPR